MAKKLLTLTLVLTFAVFSVAQEKKKKKRGKKKGRVAMKCPISGKDAKKEFAVDYKKAKVYFCCPNCPKAFKADNEAHALKANHQLVATRQAYQTKCPLSGEKLNRKTAVRVAGTRVTFCCENCQAKVKEAKGDAQLKLVYSSKAFDKAFKVGKRPARKKKKKGTE